MRSVYLEDIALKEDSFSLKTKDMHHLVQVVRVKEGQEINIFDNKSNAYLVLVKEINKKLISFEKLKKIEIDKGQIKLEVAVGKLKKEAMDLSIKQLVEIGINKIYIYESKYSQSYDLKEERVKKIIISAMEQSNNFLFPQIKLIEFDKIKDINKNLIYFSSIKEKHQKIDTYYDESLIIIGPEGGLSQEEEDTLKENEAKFINLDTNILRASTAISFCTGYILSKLN